MLPLIFLVIGVLAQQTFAEEPEAIVGGSPAAPGEFPHQCSLRYKGSHVCGCSIIDTTKILTAAHCVDGIATPPYSNYKVATGTLSLTEGEIHDVAEAVIHPEYIGKRSNAWANDVAVITLKTPIEFNDNQKPIPLADSQPAPKQQCTLSGWGQIRFLGPLSKNLLKMDQTVVDPEECQKIHPGVPLTGSHLCALDKRGVGACQGDSGGPLIANGKQIGITSWVLPCARGVPDAYTNVAYHHDWILSQ